jgi:hypothetical protein
MQRSFTGSFVEESQAKAKKIFKANKESEVRTCRDLSIGKHQKSRIKKKNKFI